MALYDIESSKYTKLKKAYVVENGKYVKLKKAYVVEGGKYVKIWSGGGELSYYGTATALSRARGELSATTVGNYALFGGGIYAEAKSDGSGYNEYVVNTVDAYNTSLTRSKPSTLLHASKRLASTTVGNYAIFAGGMKDSSTSIAGATAYNSSLSVSSLTGLSVARYNLSATTVGNYAIFAGGYGNSTYWATVDAYNASLTRSIPTQLQTARYNMGATTVGNYALFGGGYKYLDKTTYYYSLVDAYDTSLTRTIQTPLSVAREQLASTTVGNFALFGGGYGENPDNVNMGAYKRTVDAYNASLTRSLAPDLKSNDENYFSYMLSATTIADYALFGGGFVTTKTVNAYDSSLTQSIPPETSSIHMSGGATTVGNYALFGGSSSTGPLFYDVVDVYQVTD